MAKLLSFMAKPLLCQIPSLCKKVVAGSMLQNKASVEQVVKCVLQQIHTDVLAPNVTADRNQMNNIKQPQSEPWNSILNLQPGNFKEIFATLKTVNQNIYRHTGACNFSLFSLLKKLISIFKFRYFRYFD
jgi:hypothetical protein